MKHRKWREPGDHPARDTLMRHLDGELPPDDSGALAEHLRQCWTCRAYTEQLERGIRRFIDGRDRLLKADIVAPPSRWEGFGLRLRAAEREMPATDSLITRLRIAVQHLPRPALISGGFAAAMVTVLVAHSILLPPAHEKPAAQKTGTGAAARPVSPPASVQQTPQIAVLRPRIAEPAPVAPSIAAPPSAGELAETEWRARFTLHRIGADCGEDLRFETEPGAVALAGIVESDEERQRLAIQLQNLPHLAIRVRTVAESVAPAPRSTPTAGAITIATPVPAFAKELEFRFPGGGDRATFVNSVLAASVQASSEAFALRALLDRYDARSVDLLRPESRSEIEQVLRDQVSAIEAAIDAAETRTRPFLAENSLAPAGTPSPLTWRQRLARIASLAMDIHERTLEGFSGARSQESADSVRSALDTDFHSIQTLLQMARPQLKQPFVQPEEK